MKKIPLAIAAILCTMSLEASSFSNHFGSFMNDFTGTYSSYKTVRELNRDQRDYKRNESGLVNASMAAKWINDWESNRPANVDGRLFVLQIGLLPGDTPFIKHNDVNTFTFDRTAGCTGTGDIRNDGISNIPMPVFAGGAPNGMDGAFWAYDINPNEDMLLVVIASDDPKHMALGARFLWTMNYWGMKKDHFAIMNGTAMYMFDPKLNPDIKRAGVKAKKSMFVAAGSEYLMAPGGLLDFGDTETGRMPAPRLNMQSIKQVPTPAHFDTFASMEDMMNVIDTNDPNTIIIDGRGDNEYNGVKKESETEDFVCGKNHDEQCYTAIEGRIKNAVHLEYINVMNRADYIKDLNGDGKVNEKDASMTFKSKRELKNMFADIGVKPDNELYTYCRTGTRIALLTYATQEILGYSTHMYDGSWIQWGELATATDTNGDSIMPEDSQWRTDVKRYTEKISYNDAIDVQPAAGRGLNPYANIGDGNVIVEEDEAYRYGM